MQRCPCLGLGWPHDPRNKVAVAPPECSHGWVIGEGHETGMGVALLSRRDELPRQAPLTQCLGMVLQM